MLTVKEKKTIKALGENYRRGMIRTSIASIDTLNAWTARYKASMVAVLQSQRKR